MKSRAAHIFLAIWADLQRRALGLGLAASAIGLAFSSLLAVLTLAVNIHQAIARVPHAAPGIIFMSAANEQAAKDQAAEIAKLAEVKSIELLSPEQATERLKAAFSQANADLADQFQDLMPWVVFVHPKEQLMHRFESALKSVKEKTWVEEVVMPNAQLQQARLVLQFLQGFLVVLVLLVAIVVAFVVANHIRVFALRRKREVEIMKLVGATNWFVQAPFLMQGAFIALIGSLVGVILFGLVQQWFGSNLIGAISGQLFQFEWVTLPVTWTALLVILSVFIGLAAAYVALRVNDAREEV